MNEYNHHRIIERVAIDPSVKKIFLEASDFTDFFIGFAGSKKIWKWDETAKQKYFFYLFYYDITIKGKNTIKLKRITKNDYDLGIRMLKTNNSIRCMEKSGEKLSDGSFLLEEWDPSHDEKEFFSSVNGRTRSPKEAMEDMGDTANQSDNVAFLHAMGAIDENKNDSRGEFENHLKKCFSEYLFLEKEKHALFMLGIAFHGIMDSFTPSHMDFQKYAAQDMGLHAQGDVIPVFGRFDKDGILLDGNCYEQESVRFDPGQFTKEIPRNQAICIYKKRFSGNESSYVNPVEFRMLKIFFYISDIQEGKGDVWNSVGNIDDFSEQKFRGCTIKQINDIIGNGNYKYGPKSYTYSEAAIKVISDIYQYLCNEREKCKTYAYYKNEKERIVDEALNYWIKIYDGVEGIKIKNCKKEFFMNVIRDEHLGLFFKNPKIRLYDKDPDLDEEYNKYKESKEYKEWVAQQEIDRLDRLKG